MVIKISNEALTNKDALKETVDNNEWRVLKVIPSTRLKAGPSTSTSTTFRRAQGGAGKILWHFGQ